MATDRVLDPEWPTGLKASEYVRLNNGRERIEIRGSKYGEWSWNSFGPIEARNLAAYIYELACEAEERGTVADLRRDLEEADEYGSLEAMARFLAARGYRK